jgi:non-ribosomal peptide synthetase component F
MRPSTLFSRSTGWAGSERIALSTAARDYSYDDLHRESGGYAFALETAGADIAPLLVAQSADSAFLYLGALRACRRIVPIGLNLLLRDPRRFTPLLARHGLYVTRQDWQQLAPRFQHMSIRVTVVDPLPTGDRMSPTGDFPELVLHTSSSTSGRTKAVVIETGYLPRFLEWCEQQFSLRESDRFLWAAPLHFDMTFIDFFVPLYLGATLVIPASGDLFYADRFARLLRDQRLTVVHSVPSLWYGVVTRRDVDAATSLRAVLVAGDILPRYFVERIQALFPAARIFNVYGQSEANSYLCQRIEQPSDVNFPIMMGSTNSYAEVFVRAGARLETSGVGEFVVRGPNVARGYLDADYETVLPLSEHFPLGDFPTGDLVEIRNQSVAFLGRVGAQVHEQQELELRTRCNQIPGVVQCVFVRKADRPVLVLEPESADNAARLVAAAEAIVPPHIQVCAKSYFPLNYNGKIDTFLLADSVAV